jgi:hypothetical protein
MRYDQLTAGSNSSCPIISGVTDSQNVLRASCELGYALQQPCDLCDLLSPFDGHFEKPRPFETRPS